MSQLQMLNQNTEIAGQAQALAINTGAARSLQSILRTNLGPRGTQKMLVSGAGDIRITKDGQVLLGDMQIQHPTAQLIARTATAQDEITGDGTTTIVLFIGEMLSQATRYLAEGTHPAVLIEGLYLAKTEARKFLDQYRKEMQQKINLDRETLVSVARTSLKTKLDDKMADKMADIVVDAVEAIRLEGKPIDLHMVEIMHMQHKTDAETQFIDGLVLDHGARHPDMKKDIKNAYILTLNVSLEYEKSEVNSSFLFSNAEQRQKLVEAERKVVDDKVRKIIELKKQVVDEDPNKEKEPKSFIVINQKGIDPMSLDMLCKAGIVGLRRAKRRNMERLTLAFGGVALNAVEDMTPDVLGFARHVYEQTLGEEAYTFVVGPKNKGKSCTVLIKGPNKHTIAQVKDAVRDGLRAVVNAIEDKCVIPGAGAFELALSEHLEKYAKTVEGRAQLGVKCFAEAVLVVPKALAQNSGFDVQDTLIKLQHKNMTSNGQPVGLDLWTGDVIDPIQAGVFDNYRVKQQTLEASTFTATQLLYVDEILKAGRANKGPAPEAQ
jgi:T-complex protein 1 subunit zeta